MHCADSVKEISAQQKHYSTPTQEMPVSNDTLQIYLQGKVINVSRTPYFNRKGNPI